MAGTFDSGTFGAGTFGDLGGGGLTVPAAVPGWCCAVNSDPACGLRLEQGGALVRCGLLGWLTNYD